MRKIIYLFFANLIKNKSNLKKNASNFGSIFLEIRTQIVFFIKTI